MAALLPADSGPIYTETVLGRFPVEPWNTASNLVFLAVALYWAWRTRLRLRAYPFIVCALPVLLCGFVGGTLYHATRSSQIWLVLDFVPIFVLGLSAALFFWVKLLGGPWRGGAIMAGALLALSATEPLLGRHKQVRISLGYVLLAALILTPAALLGLKHRRGLRELLIAALCFGAALFFRIIDSSTHLLPMGTHFLWHVFGGLSTFFLISFVAQFEPGAESLSSSSSRME